MLEELLAKINVLLEQQAALKKQLEDVLSVSTSSIIGTREACELLQISEPTLLKLIKEQKIPAKKYGKAWKINKTDIIQLN